MFKTLLTASVFVLGSTACNSGPGTAAGASHIGSGSGSKSTLAIWTASGGNWIARLDGSGGNFTGTPFSLVFSFTDGTATTCTATLYGNPISGALSVSSCTAGATGLAQTTGTSGFDTAGTGTYANTGSTLKLCKSDGTTCQAYD